jgi:hypothetical protein
MDTSVRLRARLIGRIAVLLLTVLAGAVAIVYYAGPSRTAAASTAAARTAGRISRPRVTTMLAKTAPRLPKTAPRLAKSAPRPAGRRASAAPTHFRTLPPGAKLPSGAQCARWVRATPSPEVRSSNKADNHHGGEHVGAGFLSGDGPRARKLTERIDGDFTGTTQEILRWAACKWGIDQNMVFAQAAGESWWRQSTLGDFGTDASACPPGHGIGADGVPGECPQSYGILQNRYPYEQQSWPGIGRSTAMNADTAYAIWRACYDGYETWLNTVPRGSQYHAGDSWGCIGRWFAGRWRTAPADGYIHKVRQYMVEKIWLTPDFKHAS